MINLQKNPTNTHIHFEYTDAPMDFIAMIMAAAEDTDGIGSRVFTTLVETCYALHYMEKYKDDFLTIIVDNALSDEDIRSFELVFVSEKAKEKYDKAERLYMKLYDPRYVDSHVDTGFFLERFWQNFKKAVSPDAYSFIVC